MPPEIEELKKQFTTLNYKSSLEVRLNDSVNQVLSPYWKQAYQIKIGDSSVYTYIRLRPKLYINGNSFSYVYKNIGRDYILAEQKKGRTIFYKAKAMDARDPTIPGFTGDLLLENLQTHKTYVLHFGNEYYRKAASSKALTADPQCYYYFTCTWGGVCNGIVTIVGSYGGPSLYSTVTCTYPSVPECPNVSWSINYSSTVVDCDDPPPLVPQPATPDPAGIVGGGYIPVGTTIPGSGFSLDPVKGHMCGIINWARVGSAYVATISGVGIMFVHPQYGIYNFEMNKICVTIPTNYLTNQRTATKAFISNWNWTADEVLGELQANPTHVPVAKDLLDRFKYLLVQNLKATDPGSSINFMGPCLGAGVPTTQAQYDCY